MIRFTKQAVEAVAARLADETGGFGEDEDIRVAEKLLETASSFLVAGEGKAVAWTSPGQLRALAEGANVTITKYGDEFMSIPLYLSYRLTAYCQTCDDTGKEGRHSICRDCDESSDRAAWEVLYRWRGTKGGWIYDSKEPQWPSEKLIVRVSL